MLKDLNCIEANIANDSLTGKILMATPTIKDHMFKNNVILICDSSKLGVFGLKINGELLTNTYISEEILDGGDNNDQNQEQTVIFIIHPNDDTINNEHILIQQEFFGITQLLDKTMHLLAEYKQYKIVSGYCFWTINQFIEELTECYWLIGSITQSLLLSTNSNKLWAQCMKYNNITAKHVSFNAHMF